MKTYSSIQKFMMATWLFLTMACSSVEVSPTQTTVAAEPAKVIQVSPPKIEKPYAMNPETRKDRGYHPIIGITGNGADAMAAAVLIGTIVGIGKIFRTSEDRNDLNGSCLYGELNTPMVSPCVNVTVNLIDSDQNVLATSSTNQSGDFRFFIPAGHSYFVQVVDRKGRTASTNVKVGRSEVVSLSLKP